MTEQIKNQRAGPVGQPQQRPNCLLGESVEDIAFEHLGFVQIHARIAQDYLEIGDRVGLNYAMRKLIGYVKATAGMLNDDTAKNSATDKEERQ